VWLRLELCCIGMVLVYQRLAGYTVVAVDGVYHLRPLWAPWGDLVENHAQSGVYVVSAHTQAVSLMQAVGPL